MKMLSDHTKKKKREEEVRATKSEAAKMMQIHGLNLGLEDGADETKDKDEGRKSKAQNAFQRKKENLEDRAKIVELTVSKVTN